MKEDTIKMIVISIAVIAFITYISVITYKLYRTIKKNNDLLGEMDKLNEEGQKIRAALKAINEGNTKMTEQIKERIEKHNKQVELIKKKSEEVTNINDHRAFWKSFFAKK